MQEPIRCHNYMSEQVLEEVLEKQRLVEEAHEYFRQTYIIPSKSAYLRPDLICACF